MSNILHSLFFIFQTDEVIAAVLDAWIDKLDNITQPQRKKLSAMALISLVKSKIRFVSLLNIWVSP